MNSGEQLVSFETAKLAKQKGFNWLCYHHYDNINLVANYVENGSSTDVEFRADLEDLLENYNSKHLIGEFYSAPTQSLLQRWLREEYGIHINIQKLYQCNVSPAVFEGWHIYVAGKTFEIRYDINDILIDKTFSTYEEALEAGLQEGLKLIKDE